MFLSTRSLADGDRGIATNNEPGDVTNVNRSTTTTSSMTNHTDTIIETIDDAIITCHGNKPIAHNLLINEEMIPLSQLESIVPRDILWDDTDLQDATMLSYKTHHWWTLPINRIREQQTIRSILQTYQGPKGSISIPDAHHDFVARAAGLFEAIDPRGHRRDCFENYFIRWREEVPFSGQHFFDWLDFGNGTSAIFFCLFCPKTYIY